MESKSSNAQISSVSGSDPPSWRACGERRGDEERLAPFLSCHPHAFLRGDYLTRTVGADNADKLAILVKCRGPIRRVNTFRGTVQFRMYRAQPLKTVNATLHEMFKRCKHQRPPVLTAVSVDGIVAY